MIYKLEFRMPTGGQYNLGAQTISLDLTKKSVDRTEERVQ